MYFIYKKYSFSNGLLLSNIITLNVYTKKNFNLRLHFATT